MPVTIILCGLAGAIALAASSERGSRTLLVHMGAHTTRRRARLAGILLLGVSLYLLNQTENDVAFALIGWTLACGPAMVIAALTCTISSRMQEKPQAHRKKSFRPTH